MESFQTFYWYMNIQYAYSYIVFSGITTIMHKKQSQGVLTLLKCLPLNWKENLNMQIRVTITVITQKPPLPLFNKNNNNNEWRGNSRILWTSAVLVTLSSSFRRRLFLPFQIPLRFKSSSVQWGTNKPRRTSSERFIRPSLYLPFLPPRPLLPGPAFGPSSHVLGFTIDLNTFRILNTWNRNGQDFDQVWPGSVLVLAISFFLSLGLFLFLLFLLIFLVFSFICLLFFFLFLSFRILFFFSFFCFCFSPLFPLPIWILSLFLTVLLISWFPLFPPNLPPLLPSAFSLTTWRCLLTGNSCTWVRSVPIASPLSTWSEFCPQAPILLPSSTSPPASKLTTTHGEQNDEVNTRRYAPE